MFTVVQRKELSEGAANHKPKQAIDSRSGPEAHLVHCQPAEQRGPAPRSQKHEAASAPAIQGTLQHTHGHLLRDQHSPGH